MTARSEASCFFDTNVVVYVFTSKGDKADRSERLLEGGGVVSVQVLNEAALTLRRKFKASWTLVNEMSTSLRSNCRVVDVSVEMHLRALEIAERQQINIYDANIVAAALIAGCTTLYSEDMHDGLVIDGLTIRNPYA